MSATNRQWRLARRPAGPAQPSDFAWTQSDVPQPGPGQALVRQRLLSLDPTSRSWMSDSASYLPPIALGDVMRGIGVATVVASNHPTLRAGMPVYGFFGWQDYAIVGPDDPVSPLPDDPAIPLTMHLGLFGHIGMSAYFGVMDIGRPTAGETVVVSAAAGAVGSLAGQLARSLGCRVVGIAGTAEKCDWITTALGFDAAVNHRTEPDLAAALARACPQGIDVYFDNVGGEVLDAALGLINLRARIVACGMIAGYNEGGAVPAIANLYQLILKRARMEGFLVLDYWSRAGEAIDALARLYRDGRLHYRVHVVEGLEHAPTALNMLFDGTHRGKLVVQL